MKKHTLICTLISAALLGSGSASAQSPTPTSTISQNRECKNSSWNPELYSFYGAKNTIVEKLANIPVIPVGATSIVRVTQGDSEHKRQTLGTAEGWHLHRNGVDQETNFSSSS